MTLLQFAHCYSTAVAPCTVTSLLLVMLFYVSYCSSSLAAFRDYGRTCLFLIDNLSNFITIYSNCTVETCLSCETNILCLSILRLRTSSPISSKWSVSSTSWMLITSCGVFGHHSAPPPFFE